MPALYTAEEILSITEGRMALGMMHETAGEVCIDSRELLEGQWFMALRGKTYDGHDFIGEAYSRGALGCIVEERANYPIANTSFPLLAVDDTYQALKILARNWRKRIGPRIALIPGDIPAIEHVVREIRDDLGRRFGESFLFFEHANPHLAFSEILSMPDTVRFMLVGYRFQSSDDLQAFGQVLLPHVVLISEETVSRFRLQLNDSDFANIPFWLMPSLKLNQGLVLTESSFADRFLPNLTRDFEANTVIFDWPESEGNTVTAVNDLSFKGNSAASNDNRSLNHLEPSEQIDDLEPRAQDSAESSTFTKKIVAAIVSAMRAN